MLRRTRLMFRFFIPVLGEVSRLIKKDSHQEPTFMGLIFDCGVILLKSKIMMILKVSSSPCRWSSDVDFIFV